VSERAALTASEAIAKLDRLKAMTTRRATLQARVTKLAMFLGTNDASATEFSLRDLCLAVLGHEAVDRLREFRFELNLVAKTVNLSLAVDGQKKADFTVRRCWFEGEPVGRAWVEQHMEGMLHALGNKVEQRAKLRGSTPELRIHGERGINVVVAHHADNSSTARAVKQALAAALSAGPSDYEVRVDDLSLLAGETSVVVKDRFTNASVVVALTSAAFLGNNPIPGGVYEQSIPVLRLPIEPVPEGSRWGRLAEVCPTPLGGYMGQTSKKKAAINELADRITDLRRRVAPDNLLPDRSMSVPMHGLRERHPSNDAGPEYVPHKARQQGLDRRMSVNPDTDGSDLMTILTEWLLDPSSPPYFVLLGEYGMGKTTATEVFSDLTRSRRNLDWPEVLLFDLRVMSAAVRSSEPTLREILEDLLKRSYKSGSIGPTATADDVLDLVRNGGLVIYDGLDEVMVAQTDPQRQHFVRELIRTLPPVLADPKSDLDGDSDRRHGRILLTCRTHHFRSVAEEHSLFRGEDRDGIERSYRAAYLLPFDDAQVRRYLELRADDLPRGVARTLELLTSVHDLADLASRPVNLRMIVELIGVIEQRVASGAPLDTAGLYTELVNLSLGRDGGKHTFELHHKLLLMEDLAGELNRRKVRSLAVEVLEDWLRERVLEVPVIRTWFQLKQPSIDVITEDLRTATFLVRPGDNEFQFAHTSLLEYFHARLLVRTLLAGDRTTWSIDRVSDETLDFVIDILDSYPDRNKVKTGFEGFVKYSGDPKIAKLVLGLALRSRQRGVTLGSTREFDLRDIDASDLRIVGPLDLGLADLTGSVLRRSRFDRVDFSGARFDRSIATQAEFVDCRMPRAAFDSAAIDGAVFRRCHGVDQSLSGNATFLSGTRSGPPPLEIGLAGHTGGVSSVAFSPDNTRLATAGDGDVRVWNRTTGQEVLRLEGQLGWVSSVAFSPDNTRIATGGRVGGGGDDGDVRLWDTTTGREVLRLEGQLGWVSSVAFLPDNTRIAAAEFGGSGGTVRLWDTTTGREVLRLEGQVGRVDSVALSPDNTHIVTGGAGGVVRLWDTDTGREVLRLEGHPGRVRSVAFSPDSTRVATATAGDGGRGGGIVRVWDATTGKEVLCLEGQFGWLSSVVFSPDNACIATGDCGDGRTGTVRLWDTTTGKEVLRLEGQLGWVSSVVFSPDNRIVACCGDLGGATDVAVHLWDTTTGEQVLRLEGQLGWVSSVAFSPDNNRIATVDLGGNVLLWDTNTGEKVLCLEGHAGWVRSVVFSPDNTRVAAAGGDRSGRRAGIVCVWDATTGKEVLRLEGLTAWVHSVVFSPDNTRLATGGADDDGDVRLWDATTGEEVLRLEGLVGWVSSVAFSPDNTRLATGGDGIVRLWNTITGEEVLRLEGLADWVSSVAFSPDNTRLATGGRRNDVGVRLWDTTTGREVLHLEGNSGDVRSVAFSGDSASLAAVGGDGNGFGGTVWLWDTTTGKELLRFAGHVGWISSVEFSPDSTRVVMAGGGGAVSVWDTATGRECENRWYLLGDEQTATIRNGNEIVMMTGGAWRHLRAMIRNAETGVTQVRYIEAS
jgi:WD40 repeat protein